MRKQEQKWLLLIFIALLMGNVDILAQGRILGYIYNSKTQEPVNEAIVKLNPGNKRFYSTNQGFFYFDKLKAGNYQLLITHVGYPDTTIKVELDKNEIKEFNIQVVSEYEHLEAVEIQSRFIKRPPYLQAKVSREVIEKRSVSDVGTQLRSTANISGIRKGGTSIDPVVRGFKFSQLNVQANTGQKIEGGCPNRMDPATSHIEIEDIESIEVYKGPYTFRYGPALGAVINLNTTQPVVYDTFGVRLRALKGFIGNWNGEKDYLAVNGGNRYWYFNFSGSNKDFGNYEAGNGKTVRSEYKKYHYRGQVGFTPSQNHSFIFSYNHSGGNDIAFPALPMDERSDQTNLISFDYKARNITKVIGGFSMKLYHSGVNHEMDNKSRPFSDTVVAVSEIEAMNRGLRSEIQLELRSSQLIIGVDYENISKDGERVKNMIRQPGLPVKREDLWNNAFITNLGLFGEFETKVGRYNLVLSTRADINQAQSDDMRITAPGMGEIYHYASDSIETMHTNFSLSAGLTRQFSDHISGSVSIGRGIRSPDMVERFIMLLPIGYDDFDYLGDPQLKPEENHQMDLTFNYRQKKWGQVKVNTFYSVVRNFITGKRLPPAQQMPLSKDVIGVKRFYNADWANMTGFELSYGSPLIYNTGIRFQSSYTYGFIKEAPVYITNDAGEVVDEEIIENDALPEIPPFEGRLTFHGNYIGNKLKPELTLRAVSAQNHVSESYNEPATPGFFTADFRLTYLHRTMLTVNGGIRNIFDKTYYEHLNRNIIGTSRPFYEPGRSFYINLVIDIK
ncbi:MAG: TonB-dependent receptor [Bacteroidales bacterium]|nr:TonB-dependent receptor [Bacteroidales bacterium]